MIHVLDPLRGYVLLAEKLLQSKGEHNEEKTPIDCYNFGPVVKRIIRSWN